MGSKLPTLVLTIIIIVVLILAFNKEIKLEFRKEITSSLPPDVLWNELEAVFNDSTKTSFWPNKLVTVKSDGLKENAIVNITYNLFLTKETYTYQVFDYQSKSFTYKPTENHPLRGRIKVKVFPKEDGSILIWTGYYRVNTISISALYLDYFLQNFFDQLETNIRKLRAA